MACFAAPATAALITSHLKKHLPRRLHIEWLTTMLWGGVLMLLVEHIAHGEVVWYPPFLTAMSNPADIPQMLMEIGTVGGSMTVVLTAVWTVMITVAHAVTKARIKRAVSVSC